jgi:hypothetical protein
MNESLIPLLRNFRRRQLVYEGGPGSTDGLACIRPPVGQSKHFLSFDLLLWNPNAVDVVVQAGNLTRSNPSFSNTSYIPHFYSVRILRLNGAHDYSYFWHTVLFDAEGPLAANNGPGGKYSVQRQGITAGWKSRNLGNNDCEMIYLEDFPQGLYLLMVTADRNKLVFQDMPHGNNVAFKYLAISNGMVGIYDVDQVVPFYTNVTPLEDKFSPTKFTIAPATLTIESKPDNVYLVKNGTQVIVGLKSNVGSQRAMEMIQANAFTKAVVLGRPDPIGRYPFYAFSKATPSDPRIRGEKCDPIQAPEAVLEDGIWKVKDGRKVLFEFGISEANARMAVGIIRTGAYTHYCSAGSGLPTEALKYVKR